MRMRIGLALALAAVATAGARGPAAPTDDSRVRDAVDRVRTKVVVLQTAQGRKRGAATGFLVRPRLVLTAAHAVADTERITAWVNGVAYPADVLATHGEHDVAILGLRAPELLLKPAELAPRSDELEPGEAVVILTGPAQAPETRSDPAARVPIPGVFRRRVIMRNGDGKTGPMLALEASVERGDSGSPVVRVRDGRVVGVLSSRRLPDETGVSRVAYAVPAEVVHPWLDAAARRLTPARDEDFYLSDIQRRSR